MLRVIAFLCFFNYAFTTLIASTDSTNSFPAKEKYFVINNITISGNNKTKNRIILRELAFKAADTIQAANLDDVLLRSKYNVINTSLFIFVRIDTIPFFVNQINIHIDVKERWYLFPVPIFEIAERNFNTWLQNPNLKRANYGFYITDENFRGLKENLSLKVRMGYAEQYGLSYNIPYINKKQTSGLGFGFSYSRNHEIPYTTINNNLAFYKNTERYVRDEWSGRIGYTHRQGLYGMQTAELRYVKGSIADTVLALTNDYFSPAKNSIQLFIASTGFRFDYRDSKPYPLKGYYVGVDFVKQGLGILKDETVNIFYITATYRKYWKMSERFFWSTGVKGKLSTSGKQAYYVQRALGYSDYVRGYELYVIDGQNFGLIKNGLRFQLVKPSVYKVPLIPTEKFNTIPYAFYIDIFGDASYVDDKYYYKNNSLVNVWQYGYGVGLDFVSYYDTVIRFEYAWNRMQLGGFYIHLEAPF